MQTAQSLLGMAEKRPGGDVKLSAKDIAPGRLEVSTIDGGSGEEHPVSVLGHGRCHLLGRFAVHGDTVQFRLDWGHLDAQRHPTMDADFIDSITGKHLKSASLKPFHHTHATGNGQRYAWRYQDVEHHFEIRVYWLGSVEQAFGIRQEAHGEVVDGHA